MAPSAFAGVSEGVSSLAAGLDHAGTNTSIPNIPALANTTTFIGLATPDLVPNRFQTNTIIAAGVMVLGALLAWNLPIIQDAIMAFKLFVVATHEAFHLVTGLLCGGRVRYVCIDPNVGGMTSIDGLLLPHERPFEGGWDERVTYEQRHRSVRCVLTLGAGYFGSSVVGFLYVFCAFDIVASKIASFTIAFGLLVPLIRVDHWIPVVSLIVSEAVLIGLWFADHGSALRFYVLFVGILHLFYALWDFLDERLFIKENGSDCSQFAKVIGWNPSSWALLWVTYDILVFIAAILAGLKVFKKSPDQMYADAAAFLPTR